MSEPTTRRSRLGALVAALAIAAFAAGCSGLQPSAAPPPASQGSCGGPSGPPDATTNAIYHATNAARSGSGLGPLRWDPQLWCLASSWSNLMGDSNTMQHRDLATTLLAPAYARYGTLGENVLFGPSSMSAAAMHDAWMSSASHRANILSGDFDSFAVAIYYANGQVWATENFGG